MMPLLAAALRLAGTLSKVAARGEIDVLDSGGFGVVTISSQ